MTLILDKITVPQELPRLSRPGRLTATTGEETPTQDGKPVIVTTAVGWRIKDPYLFNRTCGSVRERKRRPSPCAICNSSEPAALSVPRPGFRNRITFLNLKLAG